MLHWLFHPPKNGDFTRKKWFIILIAVPCIGILLLFAFLFVICYCKCRRRRIPYSKEDGSESSPSSVINHGSTLSTNGLVYQVPIDFQEYASPAFSDDWSSERSSIGSSPAKNSPGKPEELQPWMYLEGGGDRDANPPVSPASSGGSLTVAEVIGSNKSKGQTAEPLHKWNDNSDRIHIPDVTMPGVDEEEDDADSRTSWWVLPGLPLVLRDQTFQPSKPVLSQISKF